MKSPLSVRDFERAARELRVLPAALMAVAEIESGGAGFLRDGQPTILFEAHHFSRLTKHIYDRTHPKISSRSWNRRLYAVGATPELRGQREHERMGIAATLDRDAALQAASWGKFQIMGFHWEDLGYRSLQEFINAMYESEAAHLDALVRFLKRNHLDAKLRRLDWQGFARGYNGPGYAANRYDVKLAEAFARHSGKSSTTKPDFSNVVGGSRSTYRTR